MNPLNRDVWMSAADDVLAVLVTEPADKDPVHYARALDVLGLNLYHLPAGRHRALLDAILELRQYGKPITYNGVAAIAGDEVTLQWFHELVALGDGGLDTTLQGRVFDQNVELLKEFGTTTRVLDLLKDSIAELQRGSDREGEIDGLVSALSNSGTDHIRDVTASGAANRLETFLSEAPPPIVSTGFDWLNDDTHGFLPSQLWYIAGPYKSSKTRVCYNMALTTAEAGIPTAIMSRENQERVIAAQFVSMLAIRWLRERVEYDPSNPLFWISPTKLITARNAYLTWQPAKAQAITEGIKAFRKLAKCLRIYDSTPDGGKLLDIHSVRSVVRRDKRLFGGRVFFLDHLGLLKRDDTIYEKTAANSNELQGLSREDGANPITLVVLAQLNEDTIKNGEGYSAGVKGGGDPSADADVLLTTKPVSIGEGAYFDDRTELKVKFNRWGSSGSKQTVMFHPESGLILPSHTIDLSQFDMVANGDSHL